MTAGGWQWVHYIHVDMSKLHLILSSVIWQASNHISMRVSHVGMSPETKAGCGNDTLIEVVGTKFSIAYLVSIRVA